MAGLRAAAALAATALLTVWGPPAGADQPIPIFPPAAVASAQATAPAPPAADADRLRALEDQNRQLAGDLADLRRRLDVIAAPPPTDPLPPTGLFARPPLPGRDTPPETDDPSRVKIDLLRGLRLSTADGRFRVEFHNLSQVEARFFSPAGNPLANNFDIPRQRFYFSGQVDQDLEFVSILNRSYSGFDLLDAFVNYKFDPTFNVRFGRYKTPYTYEYYKFAVPDLIAPERSVFVANLNPNRQIGAMAFGRVWDQRVEYAVGVFNGPNRSFQDFNNFKNPAAFVNARPFLYGGSDLLRYVNVGGSAFYGRQRDPLDPDALRTANEQQTGSQVDNVSPTFLRFNPAATERGESALWAADLVWYYRGLTATAGYNGGFTTYALPGRPNTRVPYTGWSTAVAYFLTGEELTTRRDIEPLRPFRWRDPWNNPGAVEPYTRAAYLHAGREVFDNGLADPKLWSNDALVFDTGVNWYPNRYLRLFLDWQYSRFGSPVQIAPGRLTQSVNLFWLRTQLYY